MIDAKLINPIPCNGCGRRPDVEMIFRSDNAECVNKIGYTEHIMAIDGIKAGWRISCPRCTHKCTKIYGTCKEAVEKWDNFILDQSEEKRKE